jgi:hypothetical protein
VTALEQALYHGATLFSRGSRDDNGKLLTHDLSPLNRDNVSATDPISYAASLVSVANAPASAVTLVSARATRLEFGRRAAWAGSN